MLPQTRTSMMHIDPLEDVTDMKGWYYWVTNGYFYFLKPVNDWSLAYHRTPDLDYEDKWYIQALVMSKRCQFSCLSSFNCIPSWWFGNSIDGTCFCQYFSLTIMDCSTKQW